MLEASRRLRCQVLPLCMRHLMPELPKLQASLIHTATEDKDVRLWQISETQGKLAHLVPQSVRRIAPCLRTAAQHLLLFRQLRGAGWPQHQQTGSAPATRVGPCSQCPPGQHPCRAHEQQQGLVEERHLQGWAATQMASVHFSSHIWRQMPLRFWQSSLPMQQPGLQPPRGGSKVGLGGQRESDTRDCGGRQPHQGNMEVWLL